jgi:hypothetical protein
MPDPVDEVLKPIEVYEEDLETVLNVLNSVYHFCLSNDLFNQYKNLSNTVQLSPLTKEVRKASNRVKGLLDDYRNSLEEIDE